MITKDEAISANEFHENHEPDAKKIYRWRRHGRTQTWKTRPTEFRVPVKYGIRSYGQITDINAHAYHTAASCPRD